MLSSHYLCTVKWGDSMTRILVVDDEVKIREMICKYAVYEGFETAMAVDGSEAIDKALNEEFDVIIMDVMMPNVDGFTALKEIRKKKDTPVIMLSALGEEYDRIHGFDLGVDDYVVKPFSTKEFMMRIPAFLKRVNKASSDEIVIDGMVIDKNARLVTIDGERVQLSPKEYDLLLYLVMNRGIAVTREQILSTVWGYDFFGDDRTLDTHIKLLRKNIKDYSKYIVTLRGVGYRFEKEVE